MSCGAGVVGLREVKVDNTLFQVTNVTAEREKGNPILRIELSPDAPSGIHRGEMTISIDADGGRISTLKVLAEVE